MSLVCNGTDTLLNFSGSPVGSTLPGGTFFAAWVKLTDNNATQAIVTVGNGAVTSSAVYGRLAVQAGDANNPTAAQTVVSGTSHSQLTGTPFGEWTLIYGRWSGNTARTAGRGGSWGSENVATRSTSGLNGVYVGSHYRSTDGLVSPANGKIAEVAIWTGTASVQDSEIIPALLLGTRPADIEISEGSLVFYQPLLAGPNEDAGYTVIGLSASNASYDADHPIDYGEPEERPEFDAPLGSLSGDLAAFYQLNETGLKAWDATGNENDLTPTGTVGNSGGRVYDNARSIAAGAGYLSVTIDTPLDMSTADAFSGCCFVQLDSKSADRSICGQWDIDGERAWRVYYDQTEDRYAFSVSGNGTDATTVLADEFGSPAMGAWHFLQWEHNSTTDTISLRVNNLDADIESHATGIYQTDARFAVGAVYDEGAAEDASTRLDGSVQTLGLWRRVLTTTERMKLWMHRTGGRWPFPVQPPTFLQVGDTQNLTRTAADTLKWGQWIADVREAINLKLVAHCGDHTEYKWPASHCDPSDGSTFANHRAAVDLFISDVPMTFVPGNHDIDNDYTLVSGVRTAPVRSVNDMAHSAALPISLISGKVEFDEQMSASGYDRYVYSLLIDLGGDEPDVFIVLPFGPTYSQLDWAREKAAEYPTRRVWVVVHDFLMMADAALYSNPNNTPFFGNDAEAYHTASDSQGTWHGSHGLSRIPNLVGVFCGHNFASASSNQLVNRTTLTGRWGNTVLAVVADASHRNALDACGHGQGQSVIYEIDGDELSAEQYFPVIDYIRQQPQDKFTHTLPAAVMAAKYTTPGLTSELVR